MSDIVSIADRVETKLLELELEREALADRILQKRAEIRELENTLEKLRALQSKLE